MAPPIDRRGFLIGGALAGLGAGACDKASSEGLLPSPGARDPEAVETPHAEQLAPRKHEPLPTRRFGKTGVDVTILGLGGGHAIADTRDGGMALVERAYQFGIRFFDGSMIYNNCHANLGEVLEKKRSTVFLQTKTYARDRDGALRDLETALRDMRTDYVDAWMFHDLRKDSDVDQILAPGGALEAYRYAVDQKMVRFIGASCHGAPLMMKRLLEATPLDCVLMALNAVDSYERPFMTTALPAAAAQDVGIAAMKVLGYAHILNAISAEEAIGWALTQPISVALVGVHRPTDIDINVGIVQSFKALSTTQLQAIESRALAAAHDATFFRRGEWIV